MEVIRRLSEVGPDVDGDWADAFQGLLDNLAVPCNPLRNQPPKVLLLDVPNIKIKRALRIAPSPDGPLSLDIRAAAPNGAWINQTNPLEDVLQITCGPAGNVRNLTLANVSLYGGKRGLVVDQPQYLRLGPLVVQGQSQCAVHVGSATTNVGAYMVFDGLTIYQLGQGCEAMRVSGDVSVHCHSFCLGEKGGPVVVESGRLFINGDRLQRTLNWQGGADRALVEATGGPCVLSNCEVLLKRLDPAKQFFGDVRMDESVIVRNLK